MKKEVAAENKQDHFGDLIPLIWLIEKLRNREGGCMMNELLVEIDKNFKGLKSIKKK